VPSPHALSPTAARAARHLSPAGLHRRGQRDRTDAVDVRPRAALRTRCRMGPASAGRGPRVAHGPGGHGVEVPGHLADAVSPPPAGDGAGDRSLVEVMPGSGPLGPWVEETAWEG